MAPEAGEGRLIKRHTRRSAPARQKSLGKFPRTEWLFRIEDTLTQSQSGSARTASRVPAQDHGSRLDGRLNNRARLEQ
jgi:hypothetical protein